MHFKLAICGLLAMIAVVCCSQDTVTSVGPEITPANQSDATLIRHRRGFWNRLRRVGRPILKTGRKWIPRVFDGVYKTVNFANDAVQLYDSFAPKPDPNEELRSMMAMLMQAIYAMLEQMQQDRYRERRSADTCLSSRVSIIGANPELARQLVSKPEVQNSRLRDFLEVEEGGLSCDASFCQRNGDGQFGFGLCTKGYCQCANGVPFYKECGEGTVYDPFHQVCNWCHDVSICAFWRNPNQMWAMKHDGTIARQNPNKCVDNKDWSVNNGGLIQQWDCAITTNQQWKIEPAPGFTDRAFIMNIHSQKCMQIKGISYDNGAQIEQWECSFHSPHANQLWKLVDGHLMNMNSGKCLDATDGSHHNGVILQQWDCS
ncbi:uncharacterized protein LOC117650352 [Thrips palmi]|uniref:Uncharacterized protein LOC117650352 n=1 Tax=Thrips palmi TaxID=161013 RepID=A0A6P8ZXQ1_THRPL|nr:uncharacterized protein LOC117650352 [Thrips palmi]